jgi:CHAD domain-containing protein
VSAAARRPVLDPESPAAAALAPILLPRLAEIEAHAEGVRQDRDPECLHDLRVALRRARSAAQLLRPVLPAELESMRAELREWAQVSGPVRDADVRLERLAALRERLPERLLPGLDAIAAHATEQRRLQRVALERALDAPRFSDRLATWRKQLAQPIAANPSPSTRELAIASVAKLERRALRSAQRYARDSDPVELHELRVHCKRLRYAIEAFRSLYSKRAERALEALAELQEALGAFHDCEVQIEELERVPSELALSPGAELGTEAAQAVLAQLRRRRAKALARSEERVERFFSRKCLSKFELNLALAERRRQAPSPIS